MCGPSSQAIQPLSLVFSVCHHPSSLSLVISSLGAPPFKESGGGPCGRWRGRDSPPAALWPCRTSPPPLPPTVLDQLRDPLVSVYAPGGLAWALHLRPGCRCPLPGCHYAPTPHREACQ